MYVPFSSVVRKCSFLRNCMRNSSFCNKIAICSSLSSLSEIFVCIKKKLVLTSDRLVLIIQLMFTCALQFTVSLRKSLGKGPSNGGFQRFGPICRSFLLRLWRTSGSLKPIDYLSINIHYVVDILMLNKKFLCYVSLNIVKFNIPGLP